ncbi:hypothetical protein ZEAMMB73_Zm00001d003491 [Zea mays]|uniref:Uncharacterized protein n=1 Tax=Zea mays TaxID=4577 RepID=A0A1D6E9F7_MAIZE|nr:hypothetical protein ZEAMMB73_Zm00001d003491 [Zea mays]
MVWMLTSHKPFSSIYLFFLSQRVTYIRFFQPLLDASNEDCLHVVPDDNTSKVLGKKEESLNETSLSQMIEPLEGLLQCQGLMTDRLRTELKSGIQYWSLERKLCQALLRNEKVRRDLCLL